MATLAVTNTFVDNTLARANEVNTNFSDITTYVNARNSGSSTWDYIYATNATAAVLRVNNSTGSNNIAEFQDNGTSVVTISDGGSVTTTGLIVIASGSAAAPTLTFTGDTDSGFFRSGADDIQMAAGGVSVAKFSSAGVTCPNGQFLAENGSVGAPSFSFTSETTSGLYRVGAADIQISVAGTSRAKFSAAGVTCSNGAFLAGNGSAASPSITATADTNTGIYFDASDALIFSSGGTARAEVNTGGVEILSGVVSALDGSAAAPSYTFTNEPDCGMYVAGTNTIGIATAGAIKFSVTGSEIVAYGNVIPSADNSVSCGKSGARWTEVWAANGTIQTSSLSEKSDVADIQEVDIKIPRAIKFRWNSEKIRNPNSPVYLGFSADDLPNDARPLNPETGLRDTKSVYTSSVLAMLCAAARNLDNRVKTLEAR